MGVGEGVDVIGGEDVGKGMGEGDGVGIDMGELVA